jgi:hypothetical protein
MAVKVIEIQLPGAPGSAGPVGPAGPSSVLTIGTVTTVATGGNATATLSGVSPNQTLNLGIPRGATGATGPGANLTIGTITTSTPGSDGAASITGTTPNYVLNLTLPRGYGVPAFGMANQVLIKNSSTDYDTGWLSYASANTNSTLIVRDSSGRAQVTAPSANLDIANKAYTDAADTALSGRVTILETANTAATNAATASTIIKRDANGRAQVVDPSVNADIATKGYVDTGLATKSATTHTHTDLTNATDSATASTLVKRDANGRFDAADPAASSDVATKNYTDTTTASAVSVHNAITSAHGATGAVVGTTNTQTLTNKTLTLPAVTAGGVLIGTGAASAAPTNNIAIYQESDVLKTRGASVPARTLSQHWGTVSTYPTNPGLAVGDTCILTGSGPSIMRFNGSAWRQVEMCEVANAAARNAISTGVHYGFRVYEGDTGRVYQWVNSSVGPYWEYVSGGITPRIPVTYASGWQDYSGGFEGLAWVRANGMVHLTGLVQNVNAVSAQAYTLASVGALPAAARPAKQILAITSQGNGGAARIDVLADGSISLVPGSSAPALFYFGVNMQWAAL